MQGNIIPVVNSRGVKRRSTETPDISPAKQIKKEPEPVPMVNYLIEKYVLYTILSVHIIFYPCEIIRIYHECEGRMEKSVPRIAVWHYEACRVMTNCELEGQIVLSYPHTNNGFFFLLTTVFFFLKISFQKSLNMLRYNFT